MNDEFDEINMKTDEQISKNLADAEASVLMVLDIDGTIIYVRDILINKDNGRVIVDWFTYKKDYDKEALGILVEKIITDQLEKAINEDTCSHKLFSTIWSTIKNILGRFFRT